MGQPRNRAWRRRQRALYLLKRQDRIPDSKTAPTKILWQLHTPYGQPLPFFHRQVWKDLDVKAAPTTVSHRVVYHRWECDRRQNCGCTLHLTPNWPGGQEGWVWVPLKMYTVEEREYPRGRLSKDRPITKHKGFYCSKNWKLMYLRRNKIARQRKLGWLNYPRRPEDDFDPGASEP